MPFDIGRLFENFLMRKNILAEFHAYAGRLVARNPKRAMKVMGQVYRLGDGLVLAIPLFRNGFAESVMRLHPNMHLLATAYKADPLPAAISVLFMASATVLNRGRFSLANAGWGAGSGALVWNLARHQDPLTAFFTAFSVLGGAAGAFYEPMENRFAHSENRYVKWLKLNEPKKLASALYMITSVFTIGTAWREKVIPLIFSGAAWSFSNYAGMHLPRDDEAPNAPRTPSGKLPSAVRAASLDKS